MQMGTVGPKGQVLLFGEFRLDRQSGELKKEGRSIRLPPQAAKLLLLLASSPRRLVTREEIQAALWSSNTFVDFEQGINKCVRQIRAALGDGAKEPAFIQTVSRQGYRFLGTVLVEGADAIEREVSPYPGLLAFTEEDIPFFFGREAEIDALWTKIQRRPLLALIGPSGAGKTSFLRAGLLPARPEGFRAVLLTPTDTPLSALARALVPHLTPESEAIQSLMSFESHENLVESLVGAVRRWRERTGNVLVVVDAFEELFTQNTPDAAAECAVLLGRLTREAGAHVLLSMRDDFLFRCHDHPSLAPVFSELTPLGPLSGEALRRALRLPALSCGYEFEDEQLVEEMLSELEAERGSLPLLAFAAARLWERRDRERKRLTRQAFEELGRVGGALARHADEALERVGDARIPLVRELLRNLVTSQGTRTSCTVGDLLSVFVDKDERSTAEVVLNQLINARLLTSYERFEDRATRERRVEIIHESLLRAWPRLVRWLAQDAEGAVLRDQLRQDSRTWQDRGRREDLLWTGTSFRELALWRERHRERLTAPEEEFIGAATRLAGRWRRRRRLVAAALVTASLAVAVVTSSLWRRARAETLRAEASKLLALGQAEVASNPTRALAYTIKGLELADTEEARRFALQLLQSAPTATTLLTFDDGLEAHQLSFSPNGDWLAVGGYRRTQVLNRDGRARIVLPDVYGDAGLRLVTIGFTRGGNELVTNFDGDVRLWSFPGAREIQRKARVDGGPSSLFSRGDRLFTSTTVGEREYIRGSPLGQGDFQLLGTTAALQAADVDPSGTWFAYGYGPRVYVRSLERWGGAVARVLEHPADVRGVAFHPDGATIAASDASGEIRIWPSGGTSTAPARVLDAEGVPLHLLRFSPTGRWLAAASDDDGGRYLIRLWDLSAPADSIPLVLMNDRLFLNDIAFSPEEEWLVTAEAGQMSFWPLGGSYPRVLTGHEGLIQSIAFTPDGTTLLSASLDGTLRAWPLDGRGGEKSRVVLRTRMAFPGLDVDPEGKHAVLPGVRGHVLVVPLAGGPARELAGFSERAEVTAVAFSPDGRRVAAAPFTGQAAEKVLRVWDLESGTVRVLSALSTDADGFESGYWHLRFLDENRMLCATEKGLLGIDLRDGGVEFMFPGMIYMFAGDHANQFGFATDEGLLRFDFEKSVPRRLAAYGPAYSVALDSTDSTVATGGIDGIVRIGAVSGGEPYLFFGHQGPVRSVAFSPDNRWVASAGEDRTIRLWPVPDVKKIPPHKRTHTEFLAMLRSWTNYRATPDPQSATRWKLDRSAFNGWAELPK